MPETTSYHNLINQRDKKYIVRCLAFVFVVRHWRQNNRHGDLVKIMTYPTVQTAL